MTRVIIHMFYREIAILFCMGFPLNLIMATRKTDVLTTTRQNVDHEMS